MQKRNRQQEADSIRARLRQLADQHGLVNIARRTGTPQASMHRYLNGARVPADFCARLTTEFQVNPAWLLNGEGARVLGEVTQGTQKMAGDVLELVEAMNAVTQMRLGALTGKHHLRVLRELNDALQRYEDLRKRLNKHGSPIFRQLLDDLDAALKRRDIDRAHELRTAARQVERLCDEPELSHRFNALQAACEGMDFQPAKALQYQGKYVRELMVSGRLLSNESCEAYLRMALLHFSCGWAADARRVLDAAVALADESCEDWPAFPDLQFLRGQLMANLGHLLEGMALMQKYLPRVTGFRRLAGARSFGHALMMAGLMDFNEGLHYAEDGDRKAMYLLEFAVWREDPDELARAVAYQQQHAPGLEGTMMWCTAAQQLPMALSGDRKALKRFEGSVDKLLPQESQSPDFTSTAAQIALAAGDRAKALKLTRENDNYLKDPFITSQAAVMVLARHYRNVLRLKMKGEPARRAEAFFDDMVARGYRCLVNAA
jgi:hypothetical protein